jgi:hypothetical protein
MPARLTEPEIATGFATSSFQEKQKSGKEKARNGGTAHCAQRI